MTDLELMQAVYDILFNRQDLTEAERSAEVDRIREQWEASN